MEENNKLPLKRVELSLTKFNEVAIPHHLDLLRQHRANIIKYTQDGELGRVRSEQTNARRVTSQLRSLLRELEQLRMQVQQSDLGAFDKRTQHARDQTLKAIMDYLESAPVSMSGSYHEVKPEFPVSCSAVSTESVGLVSHQSAEDTSSEDEKTLIQLELERRASGLAERSAVLRGWGELQEEVRALRDVWAHAQAAAAAQRAAVAAAAGAVDGAAADVRDARAALAAADGSRSAWYPLAGMALGGALGGPLGLAVGLKAAAAAALVGSLLGYTGVATLIKRRREQEAPVEECDKDK